VDSLGYLSTTGLGRALGSAKEDIVLDDRAADTLLHAEFCYGCMQVGGWPFNPAEARFIALNKRDRVIKAQ
jgi:amidophosphoribosyltransferase